LQGTGRYSKLQGTSCRVQEALNVTGHRVARHGDVAGYKAQVAGKYRILPKCYFAFLLKYLTMKNYHDLQIYAESKQLAIDIHKITLTLPKFELYEEGSQIRRSSKSVTSTIVEGYGRRKYKADFLKYLIYAHAECDETMIHLDFLFETHSLIDKDVYTELKSRYEALSKKINRYMQWAIQNLNKFPKP
jgi:four helix bundle protein